MISSFITALLFLFGIDPLQVNTAVPPSPAPDQSNAFVDENVRFATAFFGKQASQEKGNIVCSPAGVHSVLLLALQGADGATAASIRRAVGKTCAENPNAALATTGRITADSRRVFRHSAGIWLDDSRAPLPIPWDPAVLDALATSQEAYLGFVPLRADSKGAARRINAFFRKRTAGAIKEIVAPGDLDGRAAILMGTASSVAARWAQAFMRADTRPKTFTLPGGGKIQVPTMHLADQSFRVAETSNFEAIELPYKGCGLSLLVLVPKGGLAQAQASLDGGELARLRGSLVPEKFSGVEIPKFAFTSKSDLRGPLSQMGLGSMFSDPRAFGKFLGADAGKYWEVKAGKFLQDAEIKVDEEGTVARAATRATATFTPYFAGGGRVFRADRPFFYVVQDTATGLVLFMGRVTNPVQS